MPMGSFQKRYLQEGAPLSGPGSSNKRIRSWLRTIYPYLLGADLTDKRKLLGVPYGLNSQINV